MWLISIKIHCIKQIDFRNLLKMDHRFINSTVIYRKGMAIKTENTVSNIVRHYFVVWKLNVLKCFRSLKFV